MQFTVGKGKGKRFCLGCGRALKPTTAAESAPISAVDDAEFLRSIGIAWEEE